MASIMLAAASRPTLAKNARMGHPRFVMGKEEQSVEKGGPAPNQLTGFGYDAAGNMTSNGTIGYNYDQENRLTKFVAGTTDIYIYDGDGQRVKKSASGVTLYWYGATGDVLDETSSTGTLVSEYIFFNGKRVARRDANNSVKYYFSDNLGSASVITNSSGTIIEESDYYPYGGEIPITNGDPNHYKFTGKERDAESGLDNFGARYDASSLGRFMTPDPFNIFALKPKQFQAWISNPQRWNKYAYALNNPVTLIDPDGLNACGTKDDKSCKVKIVLQDRTKDKKGNYNDQLKDVKNQGQYNATATVYVNGEKKGTFLARTVPSDTEGFATVKGGTFQGERVLHKGQYPAIHLLLPSGSDHLPVLGGNDPHTGESYADAVQIHRSGLGNITGFTSGGSPISMACTVVCSTQYGDFEAATGISAKPPQRTNFEVVMQTSANEEEE